MKTEFMVAITQLSAEKNLSKDVVLAAVESALVSAYKKDTFAPNQDISVKISTDTGAVKVPPGKKMPRADTERKLQERNWKNAGPIKEHKSAKDVRTIVPDLEE